VLDAMAACEPVCPSLHLPVQSGSDEQLARMRRGYTVEQYRQLVHKLRTALPDLALTTDIITGFCGETDADFRQTCDLMEEIRYDSAFMFKYSEREGTYAHKKLPDDVPEAVKGERLQHIIALQEQISRQLNQRQVGRTVEVLVQGPSKRPAADGQPRYYGRTRQGKTAIFPQTAAPNQLVSIRISHATSHTLFGERINSDLPQSLATGLTADE